MGIPGLTSYINSISSLWTQIDLQDTRLVIDGSCLCHYLYVNNGLDCRCGGQYQEFYDAVVSFFNSLASRGVESFVVFDGAFDSSGKKSDTLKKRAEDRIQTSSALSQSGDEGLFLLPLLSKLVFLQALRDRNIKFAVCDSEADNEIASLASAWNYPVLSSDSDFFIFDIKAGYIPLTFLDWNSDRLTASIFHLEKLASFLGIRAELIPLWASLLGNDYVKREILEPFNLALKRVKTSRCYSRKEARFISVASFLSESNDCETVQGVLVLALQTVPSRQNREELRQAVEYSLQEYTIADSNLAPFFERGEVHSVLRTQTDRDIVEWVLRRFREGLFPAKCISIMTAGKNLLRLQVENCNEVSSNHCSQRLRRLVYGVLKDAETADETGNITMVQEWDRRGMGVQKSNVAPYDEDVLPCLRSIPELETEQRSKFVLTALDSDTANIKSLPGRFHLVAASLRFLIGNAQPEVKMNHLIALLWCCVGVDKDTFPHDLAKYKTSHHREALPLPFDLQAAHSFAQWQCVMRDAIYLNSVLLEPLTTPCISKVFDGRLAQVLLAELDKGRKLEELLPCFGSFRMYHKLFNAVTEDKLELFTSEKERKERQREKSLPRARRNVEIPDSDLLENRFALLCSMGEENWEDDGTEAR